MLFLSTPTKLLILELLPYNDNLHKAALHDARCCRQHYLPYPTLPASLMQHIACTFTWGNKLQLSFYAELSERAGGDNSKWGSVARYILWIFYIELPEADIRSKWKLCTNIHLWPRTNACVLLRTLLHTRMYTPLVQIFNNEAHPL